MDRTVFHPDTKETYYANFHIPMYKHEIVGFLKAHGYKKLQRLTLSQLRRLYIKLRIEKEGRPLCEMSTR